jgi:hypothetical protein
MINLPSSLDRDKELDFLGNRRQVIAAKNGATTPHDALSDYLRGQDDAFFEIAEQIRTGAFDLEVPQEAQEEAPDLSVHFDETKMRVDAEELLKSMGISPVILDEVRERAEGRGFREPINHKGETRT